MTHAATDLWCMSSAQMIEAVRSGRASRPEVIDAHRRRQEAVNRLNAAAAIQDYVGTTTAYDYQAERP